MGEKVNAKAASDAFEEPHVSELWLDVAEITDDPTIAKKVIQQCAASLWNMPWTVWHKLAEQSAASISSERKADT